jgi:aminobenzoyl-glutamate utilization protein B
MERERLPGTLTIWPGVAEELLGAKAYFVRAGLFKGVDAVLFTHVNDNFATSGGRRREPGFRSNTPSRASLLTLRRGRGAGATRCVPWS